MQRPTGILIVFRALWFSFIGPSESRLLADDDYSFAYEESLQLRQENQRKLSRVKCTWNMAQRRTDSMEAAIHGDPENVRGSASGLWVRDGMEQTVRILADPTDNPETTTIAGPIGTTHLTNEGQSVPRTLRMRRIEFTVRQRQSVYAWCRSIRGTVRFPNIERPMRRGSGVFFGS